MGCGLLLPRSTLTSPFRTAKAKKEGELRHSLDRPIRLVPRSSLPFHPTAKIVEGEGRKAEGRIRAFAIRFHSGYNCTIRKTNRALYLACLSPAIFTTVAVSNINRTTRVQLLKAELHSLSRTPHPRPSHAQRQGRRTDRAAATAIGAEFQAAQRVVGGLRQPAGGRAG